MKISNRTAPILKALETKSVDGFLFDRDFRQLSIIEDIWKSSAEYFSMNISLMSEAFADAAHKAKEKLTTPEMIVNVAQDCYCGTIIAKSTIICCIVLEGDITMVCLNKELAMVLAGLYKFNPVGSIIPEYEYAPSGMKDGDGRIISPERLRMGVWRDLVKYINFIRYAEVEVKNLPPKSRVKEMEVKYINDSIHPIKLLNSTYFTTLVKSDAFKVRGHFRFQPYGPGNKDRKLIWVTEFEKSGYVRKAGITGHS